MADSLILTCPVLAVTIARQDRIVVPYAFTDADGAPIDFTGYYTRCEIFATAAPGAVPLFQLDTAYTDDDPTLGLVEVTWLLPYGHPDTTVWRLWRAGNEDNANRLHLLRGPVTAEGPGVNDD